MAQMELDDACAQTIVVYTGRAMYELEEEVDYFIVLSEGSRVLPRGCVAIVGCPQI